MLYYSLIAFLSAFLLFFIQPLIGKYILPWFGGMSMVWSTSLLFFQALLLVGYAYSHGIVSKLPLRRQCYVHLIGLGASLIVLLILFLAWETPITPNASWQPRDGNDPILHVLAILAVSVGFPYLTLSTTSPLLQAWFGRVNPERSPYHLYALSNLGSLLALVSYPFVFEPALAIKTQANLWSAGYLVFVLGCGYLAFRLARFPGTTADRDTPRSQAPVTSKARARLGVGRPLLWLALSACASTLLLAATNQMTQDIAAIPFLWILPLILYQISLILCFAGDRWYSRWYVVGLFVATFLYCWLLLEWAPVHIVIQLAVYAFLLFVACMACHGEMVRLRPGPEHLTAFYLIIALGGALGGAFVNLVAPLIFNYFWEFPLGLVACWVLLLVVWWIDKRSPLHPKRFPLPAWLLALTLVLLCVVVFRDVQDFGDRVLETSRNFYGAVWVVEKEFAGTEDTIYELGHGTIMHGRQYTSESRRREPIGYYSEDSGGGLVLRYYPRPEKGLRVGVIGLGIGTLAAYGQRGDTFRFYEINPAVIQLAEGAGGYFSYLEDCPAAIEIVPGDARLALERELAGEGSQQYDVLVLDAFSSDAIPVHLMTRESWEVYLAHLQSGGVLAAHISNRHVNLQPVLAKLAEHLSMKAVLIQTQGDGQAHSDSTWVLVTGNTAFLDHPEIARHSQSVEDYGGRLQLWTDDYSNLLQVLY